MRIVKNNYKKYAEINQWSGTVIVVVLAYLT